MLARLKGLHNRVVCCMKMLGRVFVFGRIATANMPADEAKAEVNPRISACKAFLAPIGAWGNRLYLIKMITRFGHFPLR